MNEKKEKLIDIKRHQSHHYISPKFIIRMIIVIGFIVFLFFQLVQILESKTTDSIEEKNSDDIEIEF